MAADIEKISAAIVRGDFDSLSTDYTE